MRDAVRLGIGALATAMIAVSFAACGSGDHRPPANATRRQRAHAAVASDQLFSTTSAWNAPLSPSAPTDPSSPLLMARLRNEVAAEQQAEDGPWIETVMSSTTVYRVAANQPTVAVALENSAPWAHTLSVAFQAVPIPPNAQPAAGSDAQMTIWQPATDRIWEFWRARHGPQGWEAEWGGAMQNVSTSPGYFSSESWPGAYSFWGSTASSLPVIAGTMTIEELQDGTIHHALALDLPSARAGVYSSPAQRTDGDDPAADAIPEGAHLRIAPQVDIPSLHLPLMAEEMALAAQRYGMIVRDQTHHAVGFYAEDPTPTGSNPYPALMGYESPAKLLAGFPWQDVEVLRMELHSGTGRPGPT
jgi:hypothetical protein